MFSPNLGDVKTCSESSVVWLCSKDARGRRLHLLKLHLCHFRPKTVQTHFINLWKVSALFATESLLDATVGHQLTSDQLMFLYFCACPLSVLSSSFTLPALSRRSLPFESEPAQGFFQRGRFCHRLSWDQGSRPTSITIDTILIKVSWIERVKLGSQEAFYTF